jgi:hypothetical protein
MISKRGSGRIFQTIYGINPETKKAAIRAAPPARRCSNRPFFPGYLIYIFNGPASPDNFKKKIWNKHLACSREEGALNLA